MKWFKGMLLVTAAACDGWLLYLLGAGSEGALFLFVIAHVLIYAVSRYFLESMGGVNEGIPLYLAFFMPAAGFLIAGGTVFLLDISEHVGDWIESYENYVGFSHGEKSSKRMDFDKEIKTVSFVDSFAAASPRQKKESIINLTEQDLAVKGKLLRRALLDNDPEVVHYAAATLNSMEKGFESSISTMREELDRDPGQETFIALMGCYDRYISSGLLNNSMRSIYLKEYWDLLNRYEDRIGTGQRIMQKKIEVAVELGKETEAFELFRQYYSAFKGRFDSQWMLMKFLYRQKNYKELSSVALSTESLGYVVPSYAESVLAYWGGKGES